MTVLSGALAQPVTFPCTLFRSVHQMEDYRADDMRCGDLTENALKTRYGLEKVSERLNPWTCEELIYTSLHPQAAPVLQTVKLTHEQMAERLFQEMKSSSYLMSVLGQRDLFLKLVDHFQTGKGKPFSHGGLNMAYRALIMGDHTEGSSLLLIREALIGNIDWGKRCLPENKKQEVIKAIYKSHLPKFNRDSDRFNALGISVHDIYATHITLAYLEVAGNKFRATIQYRAQDHFGLDDDDILNPRYHRIFLFRIWYVLQHWEKFGYQPFMTNMEATIEITGDRK